MTLETALTILLYMAAGWMALLGVGRIQAWRETRQHDDLWTGIIDALAATVAIAYLTWWPLLLALTWRWIAPLAPRKRKDDGPG